MDTTTARQGNGYGTARGPLSAAAVDGRAARATGNHLSSQNDEREPGDLTREDLAAIDREFGIDAGADSSAANPHPIHPVHPCGG